MKVLIVAPQIGAVVDLTELVALDQVAARKFVGLLKLDSEKSNKVIVSPSGTVEDVLI
jgi:hypothetical protein